MYAVCKYSIRYVFKWTPLTSIGFPHHTSRISKREPDSRFAWQDFILLFVTIFSKRSLSSLFEILKVRCWNTINISGAQLKTHLMLYFPHLI